MLEMRLCYILNSEKLVFQKNKIAGGKGFVKKKALTLLFLMMDSKVKIRKDFFLLVLDKELGIKK